MSERREVLFLVDAEGRVLWRDVGPGPQALPDSRARWEAIWQRRQEVAIVAHSHPLGPRAFSAEDLSTMAAVDAALGRNLRYVVVAPRGCRERAGERESSFGGEPAWVEDLRRASGMEEEP